MLEFSLALAFHTLAAVVWVGGMFFAHIILRPALMEREPELRLTLWTRIFPRFFRWVWLSVITLLVTGYGVLLLGYRGGVTGGGPHIDIMQTTGLTMIALYAYLFFGPYRGFKAAMAAGDLPSAAVFHAKIRQIVMINLVLGVFTTCIGATGTLWAY